MSTVHTVPAPRSPSAVRAAPTVAPRADVYEGKGEYELLLDLPGVASDDLNVEFDRGELTIQATRWLGPAVEGAERPSRVYRRTFALPDSVDPEQISAALDKGVLTLTLRKRAEATVRTIKVTPQ